jgi:PEP-CTERM motif
VSSAILLMTLSPAVRAQTTQLATWDAAPTLTPGPNKDFDPQLDNTLTCSGCWTGRTAGTVTYSQSTTNGITQGTGALQANIVGKGAGGEYSVPINGVNVQLDTHFDYPLVATYTNVTGANGGVVDSRFTAIDTAVNGDQGLYTIDFDITYDVAQMRSIPWQPPEETVDPEGNGQYPQRYFWVGMWGGSNGAPGSFTFTGFDQNNINPFDAQYDINQFPVFHASFPLEAFGFAPDSGITEYRFGFLYNSVFGTLPAPSNTTAAHIFFDNLRLTQLIPAEHIDYNGNGIADPEDWSLFMAQFLVNSPPVPVANPDISFDLVGNFGAGGTNGVVDFHDLLKFQDFYRLANPAGAAALFGTVPEPSALVLLAIAIAGLVASRTRRFAPSLTMLGTVALVVITLQNAAQAQLVEGWETLGNWTIGNSFAQGANPSVALETSKGVTEGTHSFKVTQEVVITGSGFSWNAGTNPTWVSMDMPFDTLAAAVRTGAEHYNVLIDYYFDPADLPGISEANITLGLNFVGQTIGAYAGETEVVQGTASIPLDVFGLGDVVDQGTTSYSAQLGVTATGDVDPFSFYVDNLRLEQISTPDLLTLEIDRSNGIGTLKNLTSNPISWNYFDIKSAGGSLNASGWSSLDDQNTDGAGTWIKAGGSSATEVAEASLLGSHVMMPNDTISLGNLYNNGINAEDLDFVIRRADGPIDRTYDQLVTYINMAPEGAIGDYNNDGTVNAADYTVWRNNLGADGSVLLHRDSANSGNVNEDDYNSWKAHFGETAGGGSGGLAANSVPEPSAFVLGLVALLGICTSRRARFA